jgi:subtilisin family serine protease
VNNGATARASFSNHGPNVEGNSPLFIAAPGELIESLFTREYQDTNFGQLNGTSMATPHVAAVAALVQTADPDLNASAVAANLACNATVAGFDSNNDFGSGLLSAERSVTTALNGGSANPYAGLTVEVTPNLGDVTVTEYGTFNIDNLPAGDYTLRVSGQTETVPVEVRYETGDRAGVQLPVGSLCGN